MSSASSQSGDVDRRRLMQGAFAAGAAAMGASWLGPHAVAEAAGATKRRIKQSVAFWCFNAAGEKWSVEKTCQVAKELGCLSVELVGPGDWGVLKSHGLLCAMAPNGMPAPSFARGWNNTTYHEELISRTRAAIDACAAAGYPNVIAFTGYKWRDAADAKSGEIPRDEATDNCVRGLKQVITHAEQNGVNLCLEHLNTRDDSHPMKGHPGYQGDDLDWVAGIVRRVGSKRMKLLFDIYHVQIMHGDVIRRLEQHKEIIGHVHTAGNPGRGELNDQQEINYPPIMRKLLELDYQGYVGQEFIPTGNPSEGLRHAVRLCDV
jgi:hydroxypyruvate isomerase